MSSFDPNDPDEEGSTPNSDPWTTVTRTVQTAEAHVLKTMLESRGLEVVVQDEHIISIQPLYTDAIGGVKIQVRRSDLERAKSYLSEIHQQSGALAEVICPNCQSKEVEIAGSFSEGLSFFQKVLKTFAFPVFKKRWCCHSCQYEWKGERSR